MDMNTHKNAVYTLVEREREREREREKQRRRLKFVTDN